MIIWHPGMTLEDVERTAIKAAQKYFENNKAAMSRALGCTVNTIASKLASYEEQDRMLAIAKDEQRQADEIFNLRARGKLPPATNQTLESNQGNDLRSAECGVVLESPLEAAGMAPMLLSERENVSEMLPAKHPHSPKRNGRGAV